MINSLQLTRLACGKLERVLPAELRENGSTVARAAGQLPLASSGCCAKLEAVRRRVGIPEGREGQMRVQKSIEIAAPPEKVWPFFVEPEKVLQWCITFKRFEYSATQRGGIGTPLYIEEQAGGGLTKMQFEVTEWKENERLALRMVSGANYGSYHQQWSLERSPSGSRFTFMEEIELPFGVIGKLLGLVAQRMSLATVGKMEAKLKALAEA
jgi:uncharacterized protein YndB with AHSA1/START domain